MICKVCQDIDIYNNLIARYMSDSDICRELHIKLGALVLHRERCDPVKEPAKETAKELVPTCVDPVDAVGFYRRLITELEGPLLSVDVRGALVKTLIDMTLLETFNQLKGGLDVTVKPQVLTMLLKLGVSSLCDTESGKGDTVTITWHGEE